MTLTTILATIGGIVVIIGAAERIPYAIAGLIRACIPAINAVNELRAAFKCKVLQTDRKKPEELSGPGDSASGSGS